MTPPLRHRVSALSCPPAAHPATIAQQSCYSEPDEEEKTKDTSGAKSSPKVTSSEKANVPLSEVSDSTSESLKTASDAQFSSPVDLVAQQSPGQVDLTLQPLVSPTMDSPAVDDSLQKTVIATSVADPSSLITIDLEQEPQSHSDSAPTGKISLEEVKISIIDSSNVTQMPAVASADAKIGSLSSQQAVQMLTPRILVLS